MHKPQRHGVQRLPRTNIEAIVYKLFVFGKMSSFQRSMTAVAFIVKENIRDVFHMYTDLVGTARFEHTLHKCHIPQALQHTVVGNGMLAWSSGRTVICIRSLGLRPTLPTIVPSSCSTFPQTRAR